MYLLASVKLCNTVLNRVPYPIMYIRRTIAFVAESCVIDGIQHEATAEDAAELAEYVRGKLNLAFSLACQGEQERRSGHPASAEAYQRKWEEAMAEVKPLLPLVRKGGVSLFPTEKPQSLG